MTDEPQYYKPAFRLRLLGYSRRDVAVAFAEGRMALHQLRAQAVTLTEQVAKLDREVERMRAELDATRAREHELQRLREFGPPEVELVAPMPYTGLQTLLNEANPSGLHNLLEGRELR